MNIFGSHHSDYQKERDLIIEKSGKYLVQCNQLNSSIKLSHFKHHDRLLQFPAFLLLISRTVTRCMERRRYISIITVTWEMGNANQMVSSESCLAPAALPRDRRSEFGSLSHP